MGRWHDRERGDLAVPVVMFWLATVFAFLFICFIPYVEAHGGLTRTGRWLTNAILFPVGLALLFYAKHGPPMRFFALYGFVALAGLWIYVDLAAKKKNEKSGSRNLQP